VAPLSQAAAAKVREAEIGAGASRYELVTKPRRVIDQLELPCCVSAALAAAMETLDASWPELSSLFHYHVTRYERNGVDADGSLILTKALAALDAKGICSQKLYGPSFTEEGAASPVSGEAYLDARARTLSPLTPRYSHFVGSSRVVWIREQLKQNQPAIIGFLLPMNYRQSFGNSNFAWLDPNSPAASSSGHCVVALEYDDTRQALRIQDSQGAARFQNGCWWMGYRVVDSPAVLEAYSLNR
jgi:hypothetical protein